MPNLNKWDPTERGETSATAVKPQISNRTTARAAKTVGFRFITTLTERLSYLDRLGIGPVLGRTTERAANFQSCSLQVGRLAVNTHKHQRYTREDTKR